MLCFFMALLSYSSDTICSSCNFWFEISVKLIIHHSHRFEFEHSIKSILRVRCAINCGKDLKVGLEDDNEKDGEKDVGPNDVFESLWH